MSTPRPTREVWDAEEVVAPELAAALVAEQFPDLSPARVEPLGAGFDNTVYLVNGAWVFRFPRRQVAVDLLSVEAEVLPQLRSRPRGTPPAGRPPARARPRRGPPGWRSHRPRAGGRGRASGSARRAARDARAPARPATRDRFFAVYGEVSEASLDRARLRALHHSAAVAVYAHATGDRALLAEGLRALRNLRS